MSRPALILLVDDVMQNHQVLNNILKVEHEVVFARDGKTATRHIPVIFLTTLDEPIQETRALDIGAVDFITRPISNPVLRVRIRLHITLKRQSDQLRDFSLTDGLAGVASPGSTRHRRGNRPRWCRSISACREGAASRLPSRCGPIPPPPMRRLWR